MNETIAALLKIQDGNYIMDKIITQHQYQTWKQQVLFDRLQGLRTGQSFCNYFDVTDNILYYYAITEETRILDYIEENYVQ